MSLPRGGELLGGLAIQSSLNTLCRVWHEMTALAAHQAYLTEVLDRQSARRRLIDSSHTFPQQPEIKGWTPRPYENAEAGPSKRNVVNYVEEEETVRNDLTERYVRSGEFGSNYILGASDREICEE